jgi:transposase
MPKTRPAYAPEYRARIIELARAGRTPEELAREFEPCSHTIRSWLRAADRGGLSPARIGGALDPDEREELRRLRRENKQLRMERDILSKAAAWFAQNDATSSRSSNS